MKTQEWQMLRKEFHVALKDHESAVHDFLKSRSVQSGVRMRKAYEKAADLRQTLKHYNPDQKLESNRKC